MDTNNLVQKLARLTELDPASIVALDRIVTERLSQIDKGYGPDHDDEHEPGELAHAAIAYLGEMYPGKGILDHFWPWEHGFDRDRDDDMDRAGAFVVASIARDVRGSLV